MRRRKVVSDGLENETQHPMMAMILVGKEHNQLFLCYQDTCLDRMAAYLRFGPLLLC